MGVGIASEESYTQLYLPSRTWNGGIGFSQDLSVRI